MNEIGLSSALFGADFDPAKHLPMMAENGIRQVELSTNCFPIWSDAKQLAGLRAVLADCDVGVNSIHAPFSAELDISHPDPVRRRETLDTIRLCLDRLVDLGGRCLVVHPSSEPIEDAERLRRIETSLASLESLGPRVPTDASVKIAIENLPRTCLVNNSREALAFMDRLDNSLFGICQDVNHANCQEDLLEATRAYAKHVCTLHVSDNDGVDERHWLPGRGVIPWREWARVLLDAGFTGPWMYETGPWPDKEGRPQTDETLIRGTRRNAEEWFRRELSCL